MKKLREKYIIIVIVLLYCKIKTNIQKQLWLLFKIKFGWDPLKHQQCEGKEEEKNS